MITEVQLERSTATADTARLPAPLDLRLSLLSAGDMGPSGGPNPRRDAWLQRQGVAPHKTALRHQTHSRRVAIVNPQTVVDYHYEADGMLCADAGVSLAVTVADCMPIFVWDRLRGVRAALHSGWKGTGIVAVALDLLHAEWGSEAADLEVVLGPCIGACCYRVERARALEFGARWGDNTVRRDAAGAAYLDLRAANRAILFERGVRSLTEVNECTVCSRDLGSYRRQGAGSFVRMLAIAVGEANSYE
ncbi:MAG: laccase domain-containing protein [Spirochaetaceae bacterium]|nr:MAG: laccase domain-containing protein [Spirochaetaceae bacterium]